MERAGAGTCPLEDVRRRWLQSRTNLAACAGACGGRGGARQVVASPAMPLRTQHHVLARLGAEVTGLDFSDEAIKLARSLSDELKIPARFICADIYDAPTALGDQLDVVFTSYGAVTWLPDMQRWAPIIAQSLKPSGFFYIADEHPFASIFNHQDDASALTIQYPYFREEMILSSGGQDYADPSYKNEHDNAEWISHD